MARVSGNENTEKALPKEVRNLVVRKLEVRRREQMQLYADACEFAHSKMCAEVAKEIAARRLGRALSSIPVTDFGENVDTAIAITKSWPSIVWECITSVLNKADISYCDARELHALVDELAWAEEQEPFTYLYLAPNQFMDKFCREISRYGIQFDVSKTDFSNQLKSRAAVAKCGILNTARWARQEISIAIDEFSIMQSANKLKPPDASTVDDGIALCEEENALSHEATGFHRCEIFRQMEKLRFDEVSIMFVGDKSEFGLGSNSMLRVSARDHARRMTLGEFGLADNRKGSLNGQAGVLLAMAGKSPLPCIPKNALKVTRLRTVLRRNFGISGNPFYPPNKSTGWSPRFQVADKRGVADERAQAEAERKTCSLEEQNYSSAAYDIDEPFEQKGDAPGKWFKKNDLGYKG